MIFPQEVSHDRFHPLRRHDALPFPAGAARCPLTDETLLPLIRQALARQGLALPLQPELEVFPSRERVLVFVRPRPLPVEPEQKPTYKLC